MVAPVDMEFHVSVNAACTEVFIETWKDGRQAAWLGLEAPELDQFIRQLAQCRATLSEQVAEALEPNARLKAVFHPNANVSPIEQGRLLALRHPGLGWVSFVFSDDEARRLAELLAEGVPPPPGDQ